ncbi:hemolysin family protein [Mangrovicella endophytica]|uniref:hemolysin family protein n=1 Tax=Mangrovicella endophytica TaxID=2066697 RepID=UPI000C9EBBBD|nr:hemolysin family protein [Mangrovicella endophytica]
MLLTNFLIVIFLILLNGFFAMSELAVVSAKRVRLQQMEKAGSRGATRALKLIEDPTSFLSTVQVGITLVGIFAGAYGGSVFAEPLAAVLQPYLGNNADTVAFAIVVIIITYLSLILGELVPKRFALRHAESIAVAVAPIMSTIATVGLPIVWLLRVSTEAVSRLFGSSPGDGDAVTEEDVKAMIAEGTQLGVFEPKEREMLENVIRIADRAVRSIMVPRPDVVWLDLADAPDVILDEIRATGHSRFPVSDRESDDIVGIVQTKDLLEQISKNGTIDLPAAMREPIYVHETMPILKLLERFRSSNLHMAIVLDEYGSFEGVVTPTDILVGIAGALPEGAEEDMTAIQREDGSWLVDAAMPIDAVEDRLQTVRFPATRDYETLAGFVLDRLGHIPEVGEVMEWEGWRFEVIDLDGRRIDKLMMMPPKPAADMGDPEA